MIFEEKTKRLSFFLFVRKHLFEHVFFVVFAIVCMLVIVSSSWRYNDNHDDDDDDDDDDDSDDSDDSDDDCYYCH